MWVPTRICRTCGGKCVTRYPGTGLVADHRLGRRCSTVTSAATARLLSRPAESQACSFPYHAGDTRERRESSGAAKVSEVGSLPLRHGLRYIASYILVWELKPSRTSEITKPRNANQPPCFPLPHPQPPNPIPSFLYPLAPLRPMHRSHAAYATMPYLTKGTCRATSYKPRLQSRPLPKRACVVLPASALETTHRIRKGKELPGLIVHQLDP